MRVFPESCKKRWPWERRSSPASLQGFSTPLVALTESILSNRSLNKRLLTALMKRSARQTDQDVKKHPSDSTLRRIMHRMGPSSNSVSTQEVNICPRRG